VPLVSRTADGVNDTTVSVAALLVTLDAPPVALTITRYWLELSPVVRPVRASEADVAPLIAVHVLPLFVDFCHWYDRVADCVTLAVTLNVAAPLDAV